MSWPTVSLGEVANVNWGDTSVTKKSYVAKGFTAYSATGADGKLPYFDFDREGVVLSAIGARCGKTWFASGKWSTIKNTIRFWSERPDLDNRFLYWLSADPDFWPRRGAAQPFITIGDARAIKIPLPPLEEQKRITGILDQADALRRLRARALDKLNTLGQAIFHEMFVASFKDWPETSIDQITLNMRTGPFGSQLLHSEFVDEGIPVLGIDNAVSNEFRWAKERYITPEKYEQLKRYTVLPGDVLITIMGTCGRCAVVPNEIQTAINTKHLCCVTLNREKAAPEFLHAAFLHHPTVLRQLGVETKGAVMPGLNMGIVKDLKVPLPPLRLQQEFVDRLKVVKTPRASAQSGCRLADNLFSSLQHRAFRGEL
jgi:type I restriction enzyme S subunit